jgi:septum formation protein
MTQPIYPLHPDLKLVLASQSPRRKALLEQLGYSFTTVAPDVDETPPERSSPSGWLPELASRKARAVAERLGEPENTVIVAADTVVTVDEEWLGKPSTEQEARDHLYRLSGRQHQVMTGLALWMAGTIHTSVTVTVVHFRRLEKDVIERYVQTGEPLDKAGAYAIQGQAAAFVDKLEGCYFNVVGLPLHDLVELLGHLHALGNS